MPRLPTLVDTGYSVCHEKFLHKMKIAALTKCLKEYEKQFKKKLEITRHDIKILISKLV